MNENLPTVSRSIYLGHGVELAAIQDIKAAEVIHHTLQLLYIPLSVSYRGVEVRDAINTIKL